MYHSRVLVEILLTLGLKEIAERIAIALLEVQRGGNVEIMKKTCYVEKYGVTILYRVWLARCSCGVRVSHLCYAKQFNSCPPAIENTILGLYLL